jgi:uncharacterized protein (TIGR02246 family)
MNDGTTSQIWDVSPLAWRAAAVLLVAAVSLTGCSPSPSSFDEEDPQVIEEIESQLQAAMAGAAAADADRVLAIAEGQDDLTFVTGDVMLSGLDTIRDTFEDTYAGLARQEQTVRDKRVRVLGPNVALVATVGEGTYTDKAGWTSEPVGIGLTLVFVRENGTWRARHAHQSIALPAPAEGE